MSFCIPQQETILDFSDPPHSYHISTVSVISLDADGVGIGTIDWRGQDVYHQAGKREMGRCTPQCFLFSYLPMSITSAIFPHARNSTRKSASANNCRFLGPPRLRFRPSSIYTSRTLVRRRLVQTHISRRCSTTDSPIPYHPNSLPGKNRSYDLLARYGLCVRFETNSSVPSRKSRCRLQFHREKRLPTNTKTRATHDNCDDDHMADLSIRGISSGEQG